jgi:hypothetical protein
MTETNNISLNGCLPRSIISDSGCLKLGRTVFEPTGTVVAGDAIEARGAKPDISVFMKFDHPVLLSKRDQGIEVRTD